MKNKEFFPKSWHQFYFIITPEEFELIFSEMPTVFVAQKEVEKPLQAVPKTQVIAKYKTFYHSVLHKKCEKNLIEGWFQEEIIDDLAKVQALPIAEADKHRYVFQSVLPAEPYINLSPFDLMYLADKEQVSLSYHNPKGTLGMQLSYPKSVAWHYTQIEKTDDFPMRKIYDSLTAQIKKICQKAKVKRGENIFKPNLWISQNAKNQINSNAYLQENNLIFI